MYVLRDRAARGASQYQEKTTPMFKCGPICIHRFYKEAESEGEPHVINKILLW